MENITVIRKVKERFSEDLLSVDESSDILTISVTSRSIHDLILFLKEDIELQFHFLTTLCGVHYPENEMSLAVIYHLHNFYRNHWIRVKTFVTSEHPVLSTITDIFSAAGWMERETFDFYGIRFEGHPNLKRILNVDYLDYFPMRKEYPLEDLTREDKDNRYFGR
jgi:NADH-quinone oxidoreductase subunit C